MTGMTPIALGDAGVLSPGRWRWLRALGWMALMLVVMIFVVSLQSIAKKVLGDTAPLRLVTAFLCLAAAYAAYYAMVRWGERRPVTELHIHSAAADMVVGLLIGLGMFGLVFASLRLLGVYTIDPGHWSDWGHDLREALIGGFLEELVARLIIFRLMMRAFGMWPALMIAALIFGVAHLMNPHSSPIAALAIAIEAGLMLAAFYLLTGRIWMSVGVHTAWNFAQGGLFGAHVSGQEGTGSLFVSGPVPGSPDILSGGAFGPEASLSAVLVGFAIFMIVMAAVRLKASRRLAADKVAYDV